MGFFNSTKEQILAAAERAADIPGILEELCDFRKMILCAESDAYLSDCYGPVDFNTLAKSLRYKEFGGYLVARFFSNYGIDACFTAGEKWSASIEDCRESYAEDELIDQLYDDYFDAFTYSIEDLRLFGSELEVLPVSGERWETRYLKLFSKEKKEEVGRIIRSMPKSVKRRFLKEKVLRKILNNIQEFEATEILILETSRLAKKIRDIEPPANLSSFFKHIRAGCLSLKATDNIYIELEGDEEILAISDFYYNEELPFSGFVGENDVMGVSFFDRFCAMVAVAMAEKGVL